MNRKLALAGGISAGIMYFLDPATGRRRRAMARDKLVRAARKTGDAVDTTARDISHRARGIVAETRARLKPEAVTDEQLVARVRAKIGRVVSHPSAIEVTASQGRVTLSGPILAGEVERLLSTVARVRGIRSVENRLEAHTESGDVPALQGGGTRPGVRPDILQEHWAPATRLAVGVTGGALTACGLARRGAAGAALAAAGGLMLARGLTNIEMKRLVGLRSGRRAVHVHKTLTIEAPVQEVFTFWRNYENFPRFMHHVRDVRATAVEGQSHWTVSAPAGPIEFDAVVTELVPNRLLAWKTVPTALVDHAGIVRFEENPDGSTRVDIRMSYNPPAGALGHAVASLFGTDLKTRLDEDLVRMKTLIATGRPPHDAAQPGPSGVSGVLH